MIKSGFLILLFCAILSAQPIVKIDAGRTGEPISKYIYGQFIEHLGRCIYGGLWAEMVQDRKFYFPVTDTYAPWGKAADPYWKAGEFHHLVASPWKVMAAPGTVAMDTLHPFTGKHSVQITLAGSHKECGLSQEGLTIMAGSRYVGRVVAAASDPGTLLEIRLVSPEGRISRQNITKLSDQYQPFEIAFTPAFGSENARLEIVAQGEGLVNIGAVSLMPADNLKGWRPEVVQLLKELNAPVYRWPGGNFVSGYNWRDGIGPRDQRPSRKNPAWTGIESNDVGIHEYMDLMTMIGAEPFVAVNTGLGSVQEVADEIAYCNASVSSPMGRLRSQNGHPEPYRVKWWAVGNEMYGNWQLGHMSLEEYLKKHKAVAEAMWQVDPDAKLVAVGEVGKWSETMLTLAGSHMNLISEHIYCQEKPELVAHTRQLAGEIRRKADAHRTYRRQIPAVAERNIRIAMDEWNYWYGDYIYGELGVRYQWKDGLGVAIGLHEYFRNSDLYFMANYAQTVNVIGCIKTTPVAAAFETTGLVLKLYRNHFGTIPAKVSEAPEPLDISAAWTQDRKALTLAIVNPEERPHQLALQWANASPSSRAKEWLITGSSPSEYNEPGVPQRIKIQETKTNLDFNKLNVPPLSVILYRFEVNAK